ncbi:MAG: DNA polymerase III subunit delta' [Campylobacter sp.]|nr:DNA polymerase III subunit delta' [Campylobacter sp.]
MQSKIVITNDFDKLKIELFERYPINQLRFFEAEEFLLENTHEVIKEAYIAEKDPKMLVLMAQSYRTEAQNSLLKIIEEPPKNIYFTIATKSKNLLLQTIRSRLISQNLLKPRAKNVLKLDLKHLDLAEIYSFLEKIANDEKGDNFGKNELKTLISDIVLTAIDLGFKFSQDELEYFYKLVSLAELNAKSPQLLTPLLLCILQKGKP